MVPNDGLDLKHVAELLAENALLARLDPYERRSIAGVMAPVRARAGEAIVREGGVDRSLFFVLRGEARAERHGMEVAIMGPGQHFGELALIADRPRAASVIATSDVELAELDPDAFDRLCRSEPALALEFLRALLDGVGTRLVEMTESVGSLLEQRSLPRRTALRVRINGDERTAHTGASLGSLLPETSDGALVVAALVNRVARPLTAPLSSDSCLSPLTTRHWEGQRVFRNSLGLLLLEAASRLEPAPPLCLDHSVGFAQRVTVANGGALDLDQLAADLERAMTQLVGDDCGLREEWWTVDEAREHFDREGWGEAAELLSTWRDRAVPLVSYGKVYALSPGPLVPRTGLLSGSSILTDEAGLLLVYGDAVASSSGNSVPPPRSSRFPAPITTRAEQARAVSRQTAAMTSSHERWLSALDVRSVGAFNRACINGRVKELILVSEGDQEKRIGTIADRIAESSAKVVCIAGPSASGKTTFIRRLRVQLRVNGIRPVGISLDDYYVDREDTPRDADGELDYESFDALRHDLFRDHLARLLEGKRVRTARYDFPSGKSLPEGGVNLELAPNDVLMLEGIHGLNPRLLPKDGSAEPFRVFACPLAQLPFDRAGRVYSSDVRLIRRIVRDRHHRGYNAAANIARWPSVRAGERKHIFPYQSFADAVFDSSLIYELSVLRVYAERYLLEVPHDDPAYTTAHRLLALLDRFVAIYPDHVPPTSILREFIGDSGFEY